MKSYNSFINELKNYNEYVKKYSEVQDKLNKIWHRLRGIKGVDPSKEPIRGCNKEYMELCKLADYDKIEFLEREEKRLKLQIGHINLILNSMNKDIREIFMSIYFDKEKYEKISRKLNISVGGLRYNMQKEYEEVIRKLA